MPWRQDTMIHPPIEELLSRVDSKFSLVTLAARRARQVNAYFNQLTDTGGLGNVVPPQVASTARKPLSIAFEEIGADKITYERIDESELEAVEAGEPEGE
jgi:DNA-directed RNA polymerase subunit omega